MSATPTDYQVTEWAAPMEVINTQWAKIHYDRWLVLEINRWAEKDCTPAYVRVAVKGTVDSDSGKAVPVGYMAMFTADRRMVDLEGEND